MLEWVAMPSSRGIFPTQGSHLGRPHCRQILYRLSPQESPRILEWVTYPFSSGSSPPRGLLHCRQVLDLLSYQRSSRMLEWAAYPFSKRSSRPGHPTRGLPHCRRILHLVVPNERRPSRGRRDGVQEPGGRAERPQAGGAPARQEQSVALLWLRHERGGLHPAVEEDLLPHLHGPDRLLGQHLQPVLPPGEEPPRRVLRVRQEQHRADARGLRQRLLQAEAGPRAARRCAGAAGRQGWRARPREPQAAGADRRRHGPHLRGPLPGLHRGRAHVQGAAEGGRAALRAAEPQVLLRQGHPRALRRRARGGAQGAGRRRVVRRLHRPLAQPDPEPHLRDAVGALPGPRRPPRAGGGLPLPQDLRGARGERGRDHHARPVRGVHRVGRPRQGLRRHHGPRQGPGPGVLAARHPGAHAVPRPHLRRGRPPGLPAAQAGRAAGPLRQAGGLLPAVVRGHGHASGEAASAERGTVHAGEQPRGLVGQHAGHAAAAQGAAVRHRRGAAGRHQQPPPHAGGRRVGHHRGPGGPAAALQAGGRDALGLQVPHHQHGQAAAAHAPEHHAQPQGDGPQGDQHGQGGDRQGARQDLPGEPRDRPVPQRGHLPGPALQAAAVPLHLRAAAGGEPRAGGGQGPPGEGQRGRLPRVRGQGGRAARGAAAGQEAGALAHPAAGQRHQRHAGRDLLPHGGRGGPGRVARAGGGGAQQLQVAEASGAQRGPAQVVVGPPGALPRAAQGAPKVLGGGGHARQPRASLRLVRHGGERQAQPPGPRARGRAGLPL
ncbi:E3 SUMO-protein ligase ZBED1 isoform X1 [Odocoileus virginianus]|uniref:E3 SUMO-protein ligase ZBED1 isoform X1 n=1 Tax=Odocoileus virginianus TaxID=9874 RepID=A0ABM4HWB8_ODOVR